MKNYCYIIELENWDYYNREKRTHRSGFLSYESAKKFLLTNFNECGEFFVLKENAHYNSEFFKGDSAMIKRLLLNK